MRGPRSARTSRRRSGEPALFRLWSVVPPKTHCSALVRASEESKHAGVAGRTLAMHLDSIVAIKSERPTRHVHDCSAEERFLGSRARAGKGRRDTPARAFSCGPALPSPRNASGCRVQQRAGGTRRARAPERANVARSSVEGRFLRRAPRSACMHGAKRRRVAFVLCWGGLFPVKSRLQTATNGLGYSEAACDAGAGVFWSDGSAAPRPALRARLFRGGFVPGGNSAGDPWQTNPFAAAIRR